MNKKIIAIAVAILSVAVLFAACKKEPEPEVPSTTDPKPEITTAVDENGAYVLNFENQKVYLEDDGFIISPEDAYNKKASKEQSGISIGGNPSGETEGSISWEEIVK